MSLTHPEVTRRKLERELTLWRANESTYRRRGWFLLRAEGVLFEVAFVSHIRLATVSLPIVPVCVRLDYTNYDLWPPSVDFIEPLTGEVEKPLVPAALVPADDGPRNVLIGGHPETQRPFLCLPGIREYHDHPQHSGDSWLLHRSLNEGSLAIICDRIWRAMVKAATLQLGVSAMFSEQPPHVNLQLQMIARLVQPDLKRVENNAASDFDEEAGNLPKAEATVES